MTEKEIGKALGATSSTTTTAVAVPTVQFDNDDLIALKSFDDLDAFTSKYGIEVLPADQVLGDGFAILDDKSKLVGIEMLILEWRLNTGNLGGFVSMRAVGKADGGGMLKYIVNDGSTGIYAQLKDFTEKTGKTGGLYLKHGFRVSEYDYEAPDGTRRPAKTFYLDTAA